MLEWIIIPVVAFFLGFFMVKTLINMKPEQRIETIKQWIIQLISSSEYNFLLNEEEREIKLKELFKQKAPKTYRIIAKFNKYINIDEIIKLSIDSVQNERDTSN